MTTIQILNGLAMVFAMVGSALFVHGRFEDGAKTFLLGNAINFMVALGVGDVALGLCQAALAYYTLPMYSSRKFSGFLIAILVVLGTAIGLSSGYHFTMDPVSMVATPLAVYGAYAMSKQRFTTMAWMWIVADLLFIYVGVRHGLIGLTIQSAVFVYHGILRVTGVKQTGLFTFTKL